MPIESSRRPLTVAVVGATGLVGRTMIAILAERDFPVGELRPLASHDGGRSVEFGGRSWPVRTTTPAAFEGVDIALFSAGGGASKVFAPEAVARGAVVVDNSSQWRMEPGVPLVVAGVNDADAAAHEGIVANPNCSTMQLMPLLAALRDSAGIERVIVDTYQAVSGTGNKAVVELEQQVQAHVAGEPLGPHRLSRTRSPSTRCPTSTSSARTATPRRSGRSSSSRARSCTCRTCASPAPRCACRSSTPTRKPSTWSCSGP